MSAEPTLGARPIVIIGAGRSGTNMLRDVLTRFAGVVTWPCDEINYIWRHGNRAHPDDEFVPTMATPGVRRFVRGRFAAMASAAPVVDRGTPSEASRFLVEKTCANSLRVSFVDAIVPEALYLYLVRDGRDVTLSFKGYRFGGLNALEVADRWSRATVAADRIGHALGPDRYLRIRYEDLIALSEPTLDRLCDFVGESYDPGMLDYAGDVSRKVPDATRDLWPVLDRPPQTDKIGRWEREMKASERYVIEEAAGEALDRFGYARGGSGFSAGGELRGAWCYLTRGARLKRLTGR